MNISAALLLLGFVNVVLCKHEEQATCGTDDTLLEKIGRWLGNKWIHNERAMQSTLLGTFSRKKLIVLLN